jgi:hypothetical protein
MTRFKCFETKEEAVAHQKKNGGMLINLNRKENKDFYKAVCNVDTDKFKYAL